MDGWPHIRSSEGDNLALDGKKEVSLVNEIKMLGIPILVDVAIQSCLYIRFRRQMCQTKQPTTHK